MKNELYDKLVLTKEDVERLIDGEHMMVRVQGVLVKLILTKGKSCIKQEIISESKEG